MEVGPNVDPVTGGITFLVSPTPGRRPLRVWFHVREFGADPTFRPAGRRGWTASIPAPPVDRLEYLIVTADADGIESMGPDPGNPNVVPGPFGDKSVLELLAYRPPGWLTTASPSWTTRSFEVATDVEGVVVGGELVTPPGYDSSDSLPLLVVHDGPEYSRLVRLGDYLAWLGRRSPELTCRVLLLQPADRDLSYAASPVYTQALIEQALPQVLSVAPTKGPVVGLGASLGALALAHAAATYPGAFGGLVLQSGSFFRREYDAQEQRFRFYEQVVHAVDSLHREPTPLRGLEIAITAGRGEENLENNRALAQRLEQLGVAVSMTEGRDGHNHVAWRDLLDPAIGELLSRVWPA